LHLPPSISISPSSSSTYCFSGFTCNIGVFDRSAPLPTGGHLEQADGTAWVALYAQNTLEIAGELAAHEIVAQPCTGGLTSLKFHS
jgi:hypothetical protein